MKLDDFKQPWQEKQRELDQQVDHVVKTMRTRMSSFDNVIGFRDLRETIAGVGIAIWFGYSFFKHDQWIAKTGAAIVVLASIMIVAVVNWARLTGRVARPGQTLHDYCSDELNRVDRQIWLLRNINWWYTGPIFVGVTIEMLGVLSPAKLLIFVSTLLIPMAWFVHWLNQFAVRNQLIPLREELSFVQELDHADSTLVDADELFSEPKDLKTNWRRVAVVGFVWASLFGLGGFLHERLGVNDDAPKISPFTEVRFDEGRVIVTYEDQTYRWLSIDDIEVEDMIRSAKWRFGFTWQKRIAEDMVDVLWGMGHQPDETVRLRLEVLETGEIVPIDDAKMTSENRSAVYWNRSHADEEPANAINDDPTASDLLIDQELLSRLAGRYKLTSDFVFDVRDEDGHLMVGITNQSTQEVFPDSATHWSYANIDATIEFRFQESGPPNRLILHQNGIRQTAWRMAPSN